MTETIVINDMDGIMRLITEQKYNSDIGRIRSPYFYHGMPDVKYKLTTSIRRNCKELHRQLEPAVLRNFSKYACIDDPSLSGSVWKQMIVGQHHGLPTRLLDWTYSPLIALHFANSENNLDKLDKRDCVVWRLDMQNCNKNLPLRYRNALRSDTSLVFTVDLLNAVVDSLEQYDSDMGSTSFVNIEPPSVDQRIINQYSFFSIIPVGIEDIEEHLDKYTEHTVRYIIKKELRWDVRDLLDQFNISERIIYPGLDGLSKSLARHYFVKN